LEPEEKTNESTNGPENRVRELESKLVEMDKVLSEADRRTAEGEAVRAKLDSEIGALKGSLVESVKSYRELVIRANPDVPVEMVSGETITSVNESLEKAKGLIIKVKQNMEANLNSTRVPAGAPARPILSASALTPHEKIARGIK
jgi:hypothetical protein